MDYEYMRQLGELQSRCYHRYMHVITSPQTLKEVQTAEGMTTVLSGQVWNLDIGVHETWHHRGAGFYDARLGKQGCAGAVAQAIATILKFGPLIVAVLDCEKPFITVLWDVVLAVVLRLGCCMYCRGSLWPRSASEL
jgi:hypothetical protein